MSHKYADIAFTDRVKAVQAAAGSRAAYARRESGPDTNDRLGPGEAEFIAARDGFYLATVSETGWPYVQFRGGLPGFLRVLGPRELGFADLRGNRQYVTAGNVAENDRVSLFLMDYPNQRRLKLFGRMRQLDTRRDGSLAALLMPSGERSVIERLFLIAVEAFDWNCPQHITPRFTLDEISRDPELRRAICNAGQHAPPSDEPEHVPHLPTDRDHSRTEVGR